MSDLSDAISYFDTMPQEVVDAWLAEFVAARGWPPETHNWRLLLRGHKAEVFKTFVWSYEQVDLENLDYTNRAEEILIGLAASNLADRKNEFSNIENSKERMVSAVQYILKTGNIPGFVILIQDSNDKWDFIDGCHRASSFIACSKTGSSNVPLNSLQWAWVARPPPA